MVTVVKDAPANFTRTVASLASQSDTGFEFVVIDSSSESGTVENSITARSCSYTWTPPAGIYAAMNMGLEKAAGRYVYFLNAGDVLHDANTLSRVREALEPTLPSWAFGPVLIISVDGSATVTPDWDYHAHRSSLFALGQFPSHQGTFVKRTLLSSLGGFDTSYQIAADYASFLRISLQSDPMLLDFVVADFTEGGASTTQWLTSFLEFHSARRKTFNPSGVAALMEYAHTARQIAAVGFYRGVWLKLGLH